MWFMLALTLVYGPYNAVVKDVPEPETLTLEVAIWPGEHRTLEISVTDVDAPSLKGECEAETLMAQEAIEITRAFVGRQVRLSEVRQSEQNGKIYATIRNIRGQLLSEALITSGYGAPNEKGKQTRWCP